MADPVTLTFAAIQGVSSLAAANAAGQQARTEADAERIATQQKVEQHTQDVLNLMGRQRSIYTGAGGVKLSGSATQVIEDTRKKGLTDIKRIKQIGAKRAQSLLLGGQAAQAQAIGSAAGSFSSAYGAYKGPSIPDRTSPNGPLLGP